MANVNDKQVALAKVYSGAILSLAQATNEEDALLADLVDLIALLDRTPSLDAFFSDPTVDGSDREQSIERIFRGKASDLMINTLQILNRKDRLNLLRTIVEQYRLALQSERGRVDVHVRTAIPLPDELKSTLATVASRQTGKSAQLVETVDPSIIGGVVLQIGDIKYDMSVASNLDKLSKALSARTAQEIHSGKTYVVQGGG